MRGNSLYFYFTMTTKPCPNEVRVSLIEARFDDMQKDITEIKVTLKDFIATVDTKYATKAEIQLLRQIVYGGISIILIAALGFALKVIFGW